MRSILAIALILILLILSGCARGTFPDQVPVKVKIDNFSQIIKEQQALSSSKSFSYTAPANISDFDCYGIFIDYPKVNDGNSCFSKINTTQLISTPDMIFGLFPANATFELLVKVMPAVKFQVVGFNMEPGYACPLMNTNWDPLEAHMSNPYLIGETTADITPGDNTVSMNLSMAGSTIVGECQGPGFHGNGGKDGCPPNYLLVQGNATLGTNPFCVMKYEARGGPVIETTIGLSGTNVIDIAKTTTTASVSTIFVATADGILTCLNNNRNIVSTASVAGAKAIHIGNESAYIATGASVIIEPLSNLTNCTVTALTTLTASPAAVDAVDVTTDTSGNIYVVDQTSSLILVYDHTGSYLTSITTPPSPVSVSVNDSYLTVGMAGIVGVRTYSLPSYTLTATFAAPTITASPGKYSSLNGAELTNTNKILVQAYEGANGKLIAFNLDGTVLWERVIPGLTTLSKPLLDNGTFFVGTSTSAVLPYLVVSNDPTPSGLLLPPWNTISIEQARSACKRLNPQTDLISNAEWMTMAREIENNPANWSGSTVGTGTIAAGHNDNDPAEPLRIIGDIDYIDTGSTTPQIRIHFLQSGEKIWDVAGNLAEWVTYADGLTAPLSSGCFSSANEFSALLSCLTPANDFAPENATLTSTTGGGMGKFMYSSIAHPIFRGGDYSGGTISGIYSIGSENLTTSANSMVGFRCVFRP